MHVTHNHKHDEGFGAGLRVGLSCQLAARSQAPTTSLKHIQKHTHLPTTCRLSGCTITSSLPCVTTHHSPTQGSIAGGALTSERQSTAPILLPSAVDRQYSRESPAGTARRVAQGLRHRPMSAREGRLAVQHCAPVCRNREHGIERGRGCSASHHAVRERPRS